MKEYIENGRVIEIMLENGKEVKVSAPFIQKMMEKLDIDKEEAILTWLEDEEYLINDEQQELTNSAKNNKVLASLHRTKTMDKPKAKTAKERVKKDNPAKKMIISALAKTLDNMEMSNIIIENEGKIITFDYEGNSYKIDLVQKRKGNKK